MNKLIFMFFLSFLVSGCAFDSLFDATYEERMVCDFVATPWSNEVIRDDEAMYWYINRTGWHSVAIAKDAICFKQSTKNSSIVIK